ncbi:TIGR03757 family integrating conjugative element protein [Pseudomonas chlororaphis]|uniref:TIGR03757 family integrating conjugative element protein n=1 Tax=Pseudomonas chlororaphis TaxID=587753 RepID=UPI000F57D6A7|nr:TIGR03757 family integrating conjugative element protein [Pseudomonas chlororaphis]WDG71556.1 TIGR03757 family integrating conjugative element protein [Pseudomonas chlororaphis]WDH30660.1 TIGR03757 family integrating conjugative element protein [Pseudomonas chlororaphis]WDH70081.1 TIGR03757 family integrating conjugative element protein [Pseudomonas chlororaphis]
MTNILHRPSLSLQRLVPIALLSISALAHGETWVITDQAHPVTKPAGVRLILLDEQQRLEEQLTRNLPADPRQAAASMQRYLASPEGKRLQNDLVTAQQGVTDAWSVGVEKIPAVVIDRRYVVYGEPDVSKAMGIIDRTRSTHR